jgi:hypothetical protein
MKLLISVGTESMALPRVNRYLHLTELRAGLGYPGGTPAQQE